MLDIIDNFYREGEAEHENYLGQVHVNRVYAEEKAEKRTKDLKVYFVTFYANARTRLHYHDSDQILIAKEGNGEVGIIAKLKETTNQSYELNHPIQVEVDSLCKYSIKANQSVLIPAWMSTAY